MATRGRKLPWISIHALRKESDTALAVDGATCLISIHALRKESDTGFICGARRLSISIHALRKESDLESESK